MSDTDVIDANNAREVIRAAAQELIRLKAERAEIGEQMKEVRGRVKGLIKMADFNVALRLYELEGEDRSTALDGMRLAFDALAIGQQGELFPATAPINAPSPPESAKPAHRQQVASDAWFTTPDRTELSDEGYIALARLMRASDAPLKESLRKLKTYYRILDRAIDEKRLFTICEAEESETGPSDDPDEDLPAFLRSKKEPPSDDEDGDEPGPEFT